MKKSYDVAVSIVTYNRKNLLIECISSILNQSYSPKTIYIIDNNSTDGTEKELLEKNYIDKNASNNDMSSECFTTNKILYSNGNEILLKYIKLKENTGGAGGFYNAVRTVFEEKYDWVWLMDDDVQPERNCLENLLSYSNLENCSVLMPIRLFNNKLFTAETKEFNFINPFKNYTNISINKYDIKNDYFEIKAFPFEGPLIKYDSMKKIGFPKKEFFIIADDTDYAIRIGDIGNVYMISNAKLIKKLAANTVEFDWKTYYYLRNVIALDRMHGKNFLVKNLRPFITFFKYVLKYNKYFFKYNNYFFKAFIDGFKLNLGKNIAPGPLK